MTHHEQQHHRIKKCVFVKIRGKESFDGGAGGCIPWTALKIDISHLKSFRKG
jgi:hypothetical protein